MKQVTEEAILAMMGLNKRRDLMRLGYSSEEVESGEAFLSILPDVPEPSLESPEPSSESPEPSPEPSSESSESSEPSSAYSRIDKALDQFFEDDRVSVPVVCEYKVLEATNTYSLQKSVSEHLGDGWHIHGTLAIVQEGKAGGAKYIRELMKFS